MIKKILALLLISGYTGVFAQGQFPPAAGQEGSTAIARDSSIIQSWASGTELVRGYIQISDTSVYSSGSNKATFGHPSYALGAAEGISTEVVSLGDGGIATLTFDRLVVNGPGADFAVFENSFGDTFLELAFVEVSSDGVNFSRFPSVSLTQSETQIGAWDEIDPTNIHNLAGKYRQGFGTPFDLSELEYNPLVDVNAIRFVRIIDVVGSVNPEYASYDSQGNIINDPFPTPFNSGGFDLDGVAVINCNVPNTVLNFSELPLTHNSFFLPEENGMFSSGPLNFIYEAGFGSWSGFSYSNRVNLTGEYTNDQFVAATRGGMDGDTTNFVISYISSDWMSGTYDPIPSLINVANGQAVSFSGFYATNSHMAYITMRDGTTFNKIFGGESGNDPDWFRLKVWGVRADNSLTEIVEHYLADFRFEDNGLDYIQNDWRWVDLSVLGEVKSLNFILESSDSGDYGMNTPAYFCMDNLTVMKIQGPFIGSPMPDMFVNMNADLLNVNLDNHFAASGVNPTYEISDNSNNSLVMASITDSMLALTFALNQTGSSEITITSTANGLTVTDTFSVTVSSNVGIEEVRGIRLKSYPNPVIDNLTLEGAKDSEIRIFNSNGSLVFAGKAQDEKTIVPMDVYPTGIYLIQVSGINGNSTIKVSRK
jgi:hypothetical protein